MSSSRRAIIALAVSSIALTAVMLGVTAGSSSIFGAPGLVSGEEPGTRATVETIRAAATVVGRDVQATMAAVRTAAPTRPGRPSPVGISASPTPSPDAPAVAVSRQQPAASPSPAVEIPSPSPAVETPDPGGIGIVLTSPADGDRVGSSLVVRGTQRAPTPSDGHVWVFVKAEVYDARWYTWHRGEALAGPDGSWAIDLYLGGLPGVRHEIVVGTVGNDTNAALAAYLASKPGQPLSGLPIDLNPEARVTVELART